MRAPISLAALCILLAGCSALSDRPGVPATPSEAPRAAAPPPPKGARTAEQFDTTTAEQREAAKAAPAAGEAKLGTATVSLGDPAAPGFWMETPLVGKVTQGRVVLPSTGASVQVELRPAAAGAGSRLSLAAMRLLGAALTDLPTVEVYGG